MHQRLVLGIGYGGIIASEGHTNYMTTLKNPKNVELSWYNVKTKV